MFRLGAQAAGRHAGTVLSCEREQQRSAAGTPGRVCTVNGSSDNQRADSAARIAPMTACQSSITIR